MLALPSASVTRVLTTSPGWYFCPSTITGFLELLMISKVMPSKLASPCGVLPVMVSCFSTANPPRSTSFTAVIATECPFWRTVTVSPVQVSSMDSFVADSRTS